MIDNYRGTVIVGSADLQTSVAEAEIITSPLLNFEILNDQECHMSFNGSDYIYVRALQGVALDVVRSCKIEEGDITFNFIGVKG